jgi:hypothetical protein
MYCSFVSVLTLTNMWQALTDSAELPSAANTRENNDKHSGYTFPRVDTRGQTLGGVRSGN